MHFDPEKHHRRSVRLEEYDYSRPGAYFVTVCVQDHTCLFGRVSGDKVDLSPQGQIVGECLRGIPVHSAGVQLDAFVVMPNHVHFIVVIQEPPVGATHASHDSVAAARTEDKWATHASPLQKSARGPEPVSLAAIVGAFKSACTKRMRETFGGRAVKVWQRNYYEHVIRDNEEWNHIRQYVSDNPAKWAADSENPSACPV